MEINLSDYPKGFIINGFTYMDKQRFSLKYNAENWRTVFGINLWRGNVWGVRANGTKKLLKKVVN